MKKMLLFMLIVGVLLVSGCTNTDEGGGTTEKGTDEGGTTKEFDMTARNWEFEPERIEVNKGDKVILNIESVDAKHGIAIPDYGINKELPVGKEVTIEFTANKEGTFPFACSVPCGRGHHSMDGKLVVK